MFQHPYQHLPRPENASETWRDVLLMFTLNGFGGAAALATAEAMVDSNSANDDALPRTAAPDEPSESDRFNNP